MLEQMHGRGGELADVWAHNSVGLAVARHEWESGAGFSGSALVLRDGELAVAADAALYYRGDLRAKLAARGVRPAGDTPSHLILAAYRAWGDRCAEHLEGDFAFVVWDGRARKLLCARDFVGSRPLFYAELGDTVLVASTVSAILEHPSCPRELNHTLIAEVAAGLFGVAGDTAYAAIAALPAAQSVVFHVGGREYLRNWSPPPVTPFRQASFEEGAVELRALLERAVAERLDPLAPTSIWLSGGWDSSAVYAAGQQVLRDRGDGDLRAVSISYPEGDPGREDELIGAIVGHWGASTHWIDMADVRVLDEETLEGAARRADPFQHPFRGWNLACLRASRAEGARVAFTGGGGDRLFAANPVHMSDLFYRGRWIELTREWQAKGRRPRDFFRWVIEPGLPAGTAVAAKRLLGRGRPVIAGQRGAPWVVPEVAQGHRLRVRAEPGWYEADAPGSAGREMCQSLASPAHTRMLAALDGEALEEGIEMRRPLLDNRVVAFAFSRPWWERSHRGETKRLLRAAMRGQLPKEVLATRSRRTGISGHAFERATRQRIPSLVGEWFSDSKLGQLGIVDVGRVRRVAEAYGCGDASGWGVPLLFTLQAEAWLQQAGKSDPGSTWFASVAGVVDS
jgi:asparagine synthase (glutamine-hydrolysing)